MGDAQLEPLLNAFQQTLAPSPVSGRTNEQCRKKQPPDDGSCAHHLDRLSVPLQELIKQAEAFLKSASQQPGYGIMVLKARRCHTAAAASGGCQLHPKSMCWGGSSKTLGLRGTPGV